MNKLDKVISNATRECLGGSRREKKCVARRVMWASIQKKELNYENSRSIGEEFSTLQKNTSVKVKNQQTIEESYGTDYSQQNETYKEFY